MFAKISYTWELMGASWDVLRRTKGLLIFPLLSAICCIMVMLSFALPIWQTGVWDRSHGQPLTREQQILYYGVLFLFYFCNYFVIAFFNTAIIAGAISRIAGGEPTVAGCFREAFKRIHLIAGWALVSATVGLVIRIIEERSEKFGRIIAGLIGMAWSVITFMVIPILVVEEKGPIAAVAESARLLRKTWGERVVGNFSFGLVFFLLFLPAVLLVVVGVAMHNAAVLLLCIGVAIVYTLALALVQSALQSIFQAAVYMHSQGVHGQGFPVKLLSQAMAPK